MTTQICERCLFTSNERAATHEIWCVNHYKMFMLEEQGGEVVTDQVEYARLCGLLGHTECKVTGVCECERLGC